VIVASEVGEGLERLIASSHLVMIRPQCQWALAVMQGFDC
jgi:hypothetical protein